jgi:putative ABC transport system permease protein
MSSRRRLWWRWPWRDLRLHWASVLAISAVIAIGTGVYAGLGSTAAWRRMSNDASFATLQMHDLRVELTAGSFAPEGTLLALASGVPHADWIVAADERLVVDSQVDASAVSPESETVLVSARLVGAPQGGVDRVWVASGHPHAATAAQPGAVLEMKFADYYRLPDAGTVLLTGGVAVAYDALGVGPEQFYVMGPDFSVLAEADLATLYMTLPATQAAVGRPGEINDLVVRLAPDADRDVVEAELADAMADPAAGVSAVVTTRDEAPAYRVLYEDIENDQQIWNALSALVLGAAALASFNLISRIVESQRHEIGIGMALGVARRRLAIRPALIGLQVGVLGTAAGVAAGVMLGSLMQGLMRDMVPMPRWMMPFQYDVFVRGAVFGIVPPLAAAVIPVWRAVRVEPIDAIRTGHLAVAGGRLGSWSRRVRVPGSSVAQMPARNLLRAPRRTALTALGVGAAITAMVAVLGMLDSFGRSIDRGADEVTRGNPDRVAIVLDSFYPIGSDLVRRIAELPDIGGVDGSLRIPAAVSTPGHGKIDLSVELLDLDAAAWSPTIVAESTAGADGGLVIAEKAARDLGVRVGDELTLTHPSLTATGLAMIESRVSVSAIHPNPIRNIAFMDSGRAASLGLPGVVNTLQAVPVTGSAPGDVQRAVFAIKGVASAQPVARVGEVFDEALRQFVGFLYITAGAVLVLALLIAFNSARISVDERRREHATMMAFGLRPRTVVSVVVREAVVTGVLATIAGVIGGYGVLRWMLDSLAARTLPDFDIPVAVTATTLVAALLVGVASVAVAPLFLLRRISRMNLPDTLRVME